jgi:hypothetical protein
VRAGAFPHRVLLGAGQHGDGLGQLGVRRQGPVRGQVGAQDVGQHERIPGVGLLAGHGVAVAVARDRHRVDRVHRSPGGPQAGHQQPAAGLDRHRNRLLAGVAGVAQQLQQLGETGRVVGDPPLGHQLPVGVD